MSAQLCMAEPPALHVDGNRLRDGNGRPVRLQGVNIPSLDWSNTGEHLTRSVDTALKDWKAKLIRLPLSQDRWFGKAGGTPAGDDGTAYREVVDRVVHQIASCNGYVLLDLHWSNGFALRTTSTWKCSRSWSGWWETPAPRTASVTAARTSTDRSQARCGGRTHRFGNPACSARCESSRPDAPSSIAPIQPKPPWPQIADCGRPVHGAEGSVAPLRTPGGREYTRPLSSRSRHKVHDWTKRLRRGGTCGEG